MTIQSALNRNSGIKLILFFSIVMIVSIYLKTSFSEKRCHQIKFGQTFSAESLDILLLDTSGQKFKLKDLLSSQEFTWVYFFSPNCPACRIISDRIKGKTFNNLIGLAVTAPSFSSAYKASSSIEIPFFSTNPAEAMSLGICSVPNLVKITRQGMILETVSSYKTILRKLSKSELLN